MAVQLQTKNRLFHEQGREIFLGKKIGVGGEGTVYQVLNRPNEVVKIYHQGKAPPKAKLQAALAYKSSRIEQYTAWIQSLVYGESGELLGFTTPYLKNYYPIHLLYNPKSRAEYFPNAGVSFLLQTASNIASAFSVLHEMGQVVGDINHGNLFISKQGMIKLIDCDSFQISYRGRVFPCRVGVPTFQPPEWQTVQNTIRTPSQDVFGLAVLLFHLLYLGRHPFAGKGIAEERGIEKAIAERDFIYSRKRTSQKRMPPPGTVSFSTYPEEILTLFERAFTAKNPEKRPSAKEWIKAIRIAKEKMVSCKNHPKHLYSKENSTCPWCEVEKRLGVSFFQGITVVPKEKQILSLREIWGPLEKAPPPFPKLPSPKEIQTKPSPAIYQFYQKRRNWRNARIAVAIALASISLFWQPLLVYGVPLALLLTLMNWKPRKKLRELHQVYQLAKKEWTRAKRQYVPWKRKQEYQRQKEILSSLRKEYQELKHTREQKIKAIQRDYLRTRREEFLRRFPIRHAKSSLITNRVVSILENHGIYTASDIRLAKLERVPRIGNDVKNELIAWRKDLVSRFPKPKRLEVSEQAIQKIEQEMIGKRIRWQKKAIQARDRYLRWSKICYQECAQKIPTLEKKARKLAQAEKDYLFLLERR